MTEKEERDLAASILEGSASGLDAIGVATAATPAAPFIAGLSGITKLIAQLVRTIGVNKTEELIKDLVARKGEGAISDDDLRADDADVMKDIASWYADEQQEHPSDDPDSEML